MCAKVLYTLRKKKGPKAVTGMVPFRYVQFCTVFTHKGCKLVLKVQSQWFCKINHCNPCSCSNTIIAAVLLTTISYILTLYWPPLSSKDINQYEKLWGLGVGGVGGGGLVNFWTEMMMCTFFLFCLKIIFFFSFSTGLQKLHKIFTYFPEDKISIIYTDHPIGS